MVGRAGITSWLFAVAVLVGCATPPPPDASVATWVAANAVSLRGVDPRNQGADLAPLAAAVGDAQVVGLGEAVHGVAEEIGLKHRLLRMLVEQQGFRSVAWEEDWTVGLLVDDYVRGGPGDLGAVLAAMSPQWQSRQVADVLRWLRAFNTGRFDPVRFVGVEYYLTRASAYDAVDAYVGATAPARLAELRADLRPLRPDTDDMFAFVAQVMAAPDKRARIERARRFPSVGSYFRTWFGERYRSIGITPGHGAASLGPGPTAALADPAPDRFEEPLGDAGPDVLVLDLRRPAPPAVRAWLDAPATFRGLADRGDAGFLDGGSAARWFDLVGYHRNATPTEVP